MDKSSGLYALIYDFLEARILFGYYRYGDRLPPIPELCDTFQIGRPTVRAALARLEEAGYIRTGARRAAWVYYRAAPGRLEQNAADYFLPRRDGLLEFDDVCRLLLFPLWEAGAQRWDEARWEALGRAFNQAPQDGPPPSVELYLLGLKELNSWLACNLYWEVIRYLRVPALLDQSRFRDLVAGRAVLEARASGNPIRFLREAMQETYRGLGEELFAFIRRAGPKYGPVPSPQIPFQWNIYRKRPQLRYTLSSRLIREIVKGAYPLGSYLPSLPELEKQYGVSLATVRRTLDLLEEMGVTRARQGKGTQVCMERARIDLGKSGVREGLRLCRESLQLLALTIHGVSLHTLEHAPEERRAELAEQLHSSLETGRSYYCFEIMLSFIRRQSPLAVIRECYGALSDLVAWGYPFVRLLPERNLETAYTAWVKRLEELLRRGELDAFCGEWAELMAQEEQTYAGLLRRGDDRAKAKNADHPAPAPGTSRAQARRSRREE